MSILICYDGSDSAKQAISFCARTLAGADAVLLHVWTSPQAVRADAFGDPQGGGPTLVELEPLIRERASTIAREGEELGRSQGLAVTTMLHSNGSCVWRAVLDAAQETDAELIVLGTRGHSAVESTLLGSVANGVAHHSSLPVLIVPTQ